MKRANPHAIARGNYLPRGLATRAEGASLRVPRLTRLYSSTAVANWWGTKRVDFALYCPEGLQQFPTAVLSPLFHVSYWESSDVAAFVVRQVLMHLTIGKLCNENIDVKCYYRKSYVSMSVDIIPRRLSHKSSSGIFSSRKQTKKKKKSNTNLLDWIREAKVFQNVYLIGSSHVCHVVSAFEIKLTNTRPKLSFHMKNYTKRLFLSSVCVLILCRFFMESGTLQVCRHPSEDVRRFLLLNLERSG